mmetsp:Transcript_45750/g.133203  ORF Transcript_45750/g.133203 Transcript_45750/m.133203 type:complete len:303 (-) Transcript_45750:223-1131(-)|eukprot:CAMPEP_0170201456 /NCGR_PEP_ID=MMETSP0116_2-20130129/181_1 /TAXON_ID=400756 /ORGANISM="Durinskia baltica, Strain CSIRO CS-38" /LENGTH=302 /DNA_ID=CAMNT_0010451665 /DNA_START=115 /DNA_END=1023 /DNA_ORIENTATION=-
MSAENKVDNRALIDEQAAEAAATALTALSISPKADRDDAEESFEIPQRFTKSGRKRAVPFPLKLMKVLSDSRFNDIISWTPSGKAFTIVNAKAFVADILPEHFKSAKFSSFTRKLHRWGFMRHYRGDESGAFYHKDFQKDRLDLVEQMTCKAETPTKSLVAIAKTLPSSKKPIQKPAASTPKADNALRAGVQSSVQAVVPEIPIQAPPATIVASHLDAAIELEVTRRLQERLQQVALSRMFMQQQLNNPVIPLALRIQLMEMQQKKLNSLGGPLIPLSGAHNPNSSGLGRLPRTNIQGAKTA